MNLGNARRADGHPDAAWDLHQRAAGLMPGSEKAWVNLATSCMDLQKLEDAARALKRALILAPGLTESWNNLGFLHINFPDYPAAERCFQAALMVEPRYASPHAGLAEVDFLQDRVARALEHSRRALDLTPGDPQIRARRAIHLLANGDVAEGWTLRDARLENNDAIEHRKRRPRWDGAALTGRGLVVTAEEGIGDEVLFASGLNDAIAAAGACFVECDPRLLTLFQRSFPKATVAPFKRSGSRFKPVQSYDWLPKNPPVDLSIEAGSLFRHFRPDLASYRDAVPYLVPDPVRVAAWRARLSALGPGLKIGFSWRSKELTQFRNINYTALADWVGVFAQPGVQLISLQYGTGWAEEIAEAQARMGSRIEVFEDADLSDDFETIAALASSLDLIICPSSTVSWIGGALGVPTWVVHIRPNFTRLGTDHFPGFPSMRSFSKHVSEPWSVCFNAVVAALDAASGPER
jgi:tetratricopeptide (TPR) repeat protein